MKYQKILVVCPGNAVTGGPEAMHYLVHVLRELNLNAHIVYLPFGQKFNVPDAYARFNISIEQYDDANGNLIIFPEVTPRLALAVKKARAAIWWLSLDNFLERRHINPLRDKLRYFKRVVKRQRPWRGVKALSRLLHFSQSYYVGDYLRSQGLNSLPLYEPINEKFCVVDHAKNPFVRVDEILFNSVKGKKITDELIKAYPEFKFTPLKGFSREQLTKKMLTAKIYIDFGHHPGRDRIPREAAIHGCCLITGLLGSAENLYDLPINPRYKLNHSDKNFVDNFGFLVRSIFNDFDVHSKNFGDYRELIKNEPERFRAQLSEYFLDD